LPRLALTHALLYISLLQPKMRSRRSRTSIPDRATEL